MIGDLYYVWQERDQHGWAIIAAGEVDVSGMAMVRALVTRHEDIANGPFRAFAELHKLKAGVPIRLATFKLASILEVDST